MPRLFTGIEIPAEIAQRLASLQGGLQGARWIPSDNYHLTLRFIGDVDMMTADMITEALSGVSRPAFELMLTGLGVFGGRSPRAIFASAESGRPLMDLQADHERLVQRLGLPPEGRKYTPHITLARLRKGRPRAVADYLALRGGFAVEPFTVDRFVLFSARQLIGGGPYVAEQTYGLAPAASVQQEEDN